jgi:ketosteroid isomerase-like protein
VCPIDPDRDQAARQVMREIAMDERWLAAIDPGSPDWLVEIQRETIAAYQAGDLDWVIEHTDPDVEIVQPPEFPDPRTYRGIEGLIDAFLDWPAEWDNFQVEPTRIFSPGDDQVIVEAIHRGRSLTMGIDVEAAIFWLYRLKNGRTKRWEMYMSQAAAIEAARTA